MEPINFKRGRGRPRGRMVTSPLQLTLDEKAKIHKAQDLYVKLYGVKKSHRRIVSEAVDILIMRLEDEAENDL